jgi:hypothetical protein
MILLRAGSPETFREGEPPCEPSADASSDGASPSRGDVAVHAARDILCQLRCSDAPLLGIELGQVPGACMTRS